MEVDSTLQSQTTRLSPLWGKNGKSGIIPNGGRRNRTATFLRRGLSNETSDSNQRTRPARGALHRKRSAIRQVPQSEARRKAGRADQAVKGNQGKRGGATMIETK